MRYRRCNRCHWRFSSRGKVRLAGLTLGFLLGSRCFTHGALLTLALLSAVAARCAFATIAVT